MEKLGELIGKVASYGLVSIQSGETLIPLYASLKEGEKLQMQRLIPDDMDVVESLFGEYSGDTSSSVERGMQMLDENPNNDDYGVLVIQRVFTTNIGKVNGFLCFGVGYGAQIDFASIILPFKYDDKNSDFEVYKAVPNNIEVRDVNDDVFMKDFLLGLESDREGAEIFRKHYNENGLSNVTEYS